MVAIFYYSTDFFKSAGIDASQAQYATIGVGAIMVLMTIITIPLISSQYSNMEENLFRVSRNSKMRKKNPFALP